MICGRIYDFFCKKGTKVSTSLKYATKAEIDGGVYQTPEIDEKRARTKRAPLLFYKFTQNSVLAQWIKDTRFPPWPRYYPKHSPMLVYEQQ